MKVVVAFAVLFVVAALAHTDLLQGRRQFEDFVGKYNKQYKDVAEKEMRYKVFLANLARAEQLTAKSKTATFGVTKFSDLTPAEFKSRYLMNVTFDKSKMPAKKVWEPTMNVVGLPSSFDWNNKDGVVSSVYNQEQCGSCWAFSATETIESVWALAGNQLVSLSEQQIVDCDSTDDGCNGGWPYDAYQYIESAGGQEPLSDYPYTAEDGTCQFSASDIVAKISNWQYVTQSQDENAMQQFVYSNSPISVCVDAEVWQTYTGGVVGSDCGDDIDHCVQITGWTVVNGVSAWNVRNSWGSDWGNNGYIYVAIGGDNCAIAQVVTVPIV